MMEFLHIEKVLYFTVMYVCTLRQDRIIDFRIRNRLSQINLDMELPKNVYKRALKGDFRCDAK